MKPYNWGLNQRVSDERGESQPPSVVTIQYFCPHQIGLWGQTLGTKLPNSKPKAPIQKIFTKFSKNLIIENVFFSQFIKKNFYYSIIFRYSLKQDCENFEIQILKNLSEVWGSTFSKFLSKIKFWENFPKCFRKFSFFSKQNWFHKISFFENFQKFVNKNAIKQ